MEDLLKIPAFQQVPGLIVLAFIVIAFLKYISARDETRSKQDAARDALYLNMHKEHIEARIGTQKALELTAVSTRDNAEATRANTRAIDDLRQTINHSNSKHH